MVASSGHNPNNLNTSKPHNLKKLKIVTRIFGKVVLKAYLCTAK